MATTPQDVDPEPAAKAGTGRAAFRRWLPYVPILALAVSLGGVALSEGRSKEAVLRAENDGKPVMVINADAGPEDLVLSVGGDTLRGALYQERLTFWNGGDVRLDSAQFRHPVGVAVVEPAGFVRARIVRSEEPSIDGFTLWSHEGTMTSGSPARIFELGWRRFDPDSWVAVEVLYERGPRSQVVLLGRSREVDVVDGPAFRKPLPRGGLFALVSVLALLGTAGAAGLWGVNKLIDVLRYATNNLILPPLEAFANRGGWQNGVALACLVTFLLLSFTTIGLIAWIVLQLLTSVIGLEPIPGPFGDGS